MILSLDTNVLIDLANGRRPVVRSNFDRAFADGDQLVTCSIAAHELLYGAAISRRREAERRTAQLLLEQLRIAEFDAGDAVVAADLRAQLRRVGLPIGPFDTFIAAQAMNRNWTMVTANVREFSRVEGLDVIDWTAAHRSD